MNARRSSTTKDWRHASLIRLGAACASPGSRPFTVDLGWVRSSVANYGGTAVSVPSIPPDQRPTPSPSTAPVPVRRLLCIRPDRPVRRAGDHDGLRHARRRPAGLLTRARSDPCRDGDFLPPCPGPGYGRTAYNADLRGSAVRLLGGGNVLSSQVAWRNLCVELVQSHHRYTRLKVTIQAGSDMVSSADEHNPRRE